METRAAKHYEKSHVIPRINEVYDFITWGNFAKEYFPGHSVSWFYNKMRGVDGNGGAGGFTPGEREVLKGGMVELASRIRAAADNL